MRREFPPNTTHRSHHHIMDGHSSRIRLVWLIGLLTVLGCTDDRQSRSVPASTDRSSAVGASSDVASRTMDQGADAFEVTLVGSPRAGTHRGTGNLGCMVYNGLWQASWEAPEATGLSALMLQLKEVAPSGGSSEKVSFTAVFGSQTDVEGVTALVDVHGSEFGRDGRGTVTREGKAAVIRIEGTAPQGARVTAVLRCGSVNVMS